MTMGIYEMTTRQQEETHSLNWIWFTKTHPQEFTWKKACFYHLDDISLKRFTMTVGSIAIPSEPWIQGGVVEVVFGDECFVKNEEMNKNNIMKIATFHTHTKK